MSFLYNTLGQGYKSNVIPNLQTRITNSWANLAKVIPECSSHFEENGGEGSCWPVKQNAGQPNILLCIRGSATL